MTGTVPPAPAGAGGPADEPDREPEYVVIDDPQTRAFFTGIGDAETVHALWAASQMPAPESDHHAYALWWFYLGRQSAERLPDDGPPALTPDTQMSYLAGVACRAPDAPRPE